MIPVNAKAVAQGISGGVGIALTGYSIWDNFAHYEHPIKRTGMTGAGIALGSVFMVIIGTSTTPLIIGGIIVGTAIGVGASVVNDVWYGEKKRK